MALSLSETQTITEISSLLYNYLPGKPHPYADQSISFQGIAYDMKLSEYWNGGSKLPAIVYLLENTLEYKRGLFCKLIYNIIKRSLVYRKNKDNPIMREDIEFLNKLIFKVKFKIPELWEPEFLNSLPSSAKRNFEEKEKRNILSNEKILKEFLALNELEPIPRGFAFEKFLYNLFLYSEMDPKASIRTIGEQIDGSFYFQNETYLLEAKWQSKQTNQADLLVLRGKIEGKATWSRGVFISYSGYTEEALIAFSKGKSTNMIGLSGQDLYLILERKLDFKDILYRKVRNSAETGEFYTPVLKLI